MKTLEDLKNGDILYFYTKLGEFLFTDVINDIEKEESNYGDIYLIFKIDLNKSGKLMFLGKRKDCLEIEYTHKDIILKFNRDDYK